MESVITRVVVHDGSAPDWEAVMRNRNDSRGDLSGLHRRLDLTSEGDADARVIVRLWESRDVAGVARGSAFRTPPSVVRA